MMSEDFSVRPAAEADQDYLRALFVTTRMRELAHRLGRFVDARMQAHGEPVA